MAESKRDEFYPDAEVYSDHREMLTRDDIEVIDVTPHPEDRLTYWKTAFMQETCSQPKTLCPGY